MYFYLMDQIQVCVNRVLVDNTSIEVLFSKNIIAWQDIKPILLNAAVNLCMQNFPYKQWKTKIAVSLIFQFVTTAIFNIQIWIDLDCLKESPETITCLIFLYFYLKKLIHVPLTSKNMQFTSYNLHQNLQHN